MNLSRHDRADICAAAVLFGFLACVSAVGLTSILGEPVALNLRIFLATLGLAVGVYGVWRLHRAATGARLLRDDTHRPVDHHDTPAA